MRTTLDDDGAVLPRNSWGARAYGIVCLWGRAIWRFEIMNRGVNGIVGVIRHILFLSRFLLFGRQYRNLFRICQGKCAPYNYSLASSEASSTTFKKYSSLHHFILRALILFSAAKLFKTSVTLVLSLLCSSSKSP